MEKVNPRMVTLARESKGLSIVEIGAKMGFTTQAAWHLEQSYYNVNADTLEKLSEVLHYPASFSLSPEKAFRYR